MAKYKIIPSSRTIVQSPISIGHKAEKGVEAIEFDLTAWVETYGSGAATIVMKRWGDSIPYPVALELDENNKATWTLSDIDTAKAGMAYAQLNYVVGDEVVKKSDIYTFRVMDSLTGEGEPPEAYESWLEHLTHLAAEAMAEVLDIEGIVTDKTLTVNGGIADGKATGDALALKADKSTTYTKTEVDQMIEDVEVETDTTLSVSGAPADAKKTGDALSALEDQFTEETDKLKADLDAQTEITDSSFDVTVEYRQIVSGDEGVTTFNGYTSSSKNGSITNSDSYRAIYWTAEEDCLVYPTSSKSTAAFAVYSATPLSSSTCVKVNGKAGFPTKSNPYSVKAGQIVLISENGTNLTQVLYVSTGKTYTVKDNALTKYDTILYADITQTAGFTDGYINTSGGKNSASISAKEVVTDFVPCKYGQYVFLRVAHPTEGNTAWGRYALYNKDKAFIGAYDIGYTSSGDGTTHMDRQLKTDVEGVAYIRVSFRTYGSTDYSLTVVPDSELLYDMGVIKANYSIVDSKRFPSDSMFPINVLHRGLATSGYPENTMVAFKDAIDKGWIFLETDIRVTSDGVWVLLHDATINRTAKNADGTSIASNISISNITYEQALEYDFGIYAGAEFAGTKIPTLEDFLKLCRAKHVYPVIEVKDSSITQAQVDAVCELIEKYSMQNRIFLLCSSLGGVDKFLLKNPFIPAISTSATAWSYIAPENFKNTKPYASGYKTSYNRVFLEREYSGFSSKSDMDNFVDYCHYWGIYAGYYCPTTKAGISGTSDRIDMATTQYYQYSDVKAENLE